MHETDRTQHLNACTPVAALSTSLALLDRGRWYFARRDVVSAPRDAKTRRGYYQARTQISLINSASLILS